MNQIFPGTNLLQIGRFDDKKVAQRVQNRKESVNNWTVEILGAQSILVYISDQSHCALKKSQT